MNVAVNTRFLLPGRMEGFGVYTHEIVRRMARAHVEDTYDLYFDRPFSQEYAYADNVQLHRVGPPARHPFLYYIWYQHSLRRKLKKRRPDVFFSPDSYMPLGLDVPTILTIHDVAPMRYPAHIDPWQRRYYHYFMPRFVSQASHIITVSEFSRAEILHYFDVDASKISVVYNGVGEHFFDATPDHTITRRFSDGRPYFLYVGSIHPRKNVPILLKAFDRFKEVTRSDMQLILAGRTTWKQAHIGQALAGLKFRSAVHLHGYVPEEVLPRLMHHAVALVYVSLYEGFGIPLVEAMAAGTPVITSDRGAMAEVAGDAALLTDPASADAVCAAMQAVLDQATRDGLSAAGRKRARQFNWADSAHQTHTILKDYAIG